jgi:CheY-like chemotaxis protein
MNPKATIADELLETISERQQISFNELSDRYFSRGIAKGDLEKSLRELETKDLVASRSNGGILTYYILEKDPFKRVLIVEDDKNINKLMALSIGTEFEVDQIYDGKDAMTAIRQDRPNLVILDLMLPHTDGLEICQTIKGDPSLKSTVVIIVSAMDPTSGRFKGIKYGADYYIKKPFDPKELRALVSIFLKKKGKRFDPLVDLPDEERLSGEFERSIKEGNAYTIGTIKVENLGLYTGKFGEASGITILRLVSQLLQDLIKKYKQEMFVGFLNSDEFVIAGDKQRVAEAVGDVTTEFNAVLPFIMQDLGYRPAVVDIESLFESDEVPKLSIKFTESEKADRIARREEVLRSRGGQADDIGAYTYEELQKMLGSGSLNIIISRDNSGVRLRVGKGPLGG